MPGVRRHTRLERGMAGLKVPRRLIAAPFLLLLPLLAAAGASVISDVRTAIAQKDLARGERLIVEYRAQHGVTPEMLEALSWLGRGALASKELDRAERYAAETYKLAAGKPVDSDRHLAIAVGAAIEVHAQAMAQRGEQAEAVRYLRRELEKHRGTSIRTRIQKNINLLSLEGKAAPPLELADWIGAKPPALGELKGRPVLLFFWAHWCGDCKSMAPAISRLMERGLTVIGPTQRYGYAAGGDDATPAQARAYIDGVRKQSYPANMPVPMSEANFRNYGASTTPTLVLIGPDGKVVFYHPGHMSYQELARRA